MSESVSPQQTETIISQCVCLWQQWTTTGTNVVSGGTPAFLTKTNECKSAHTLSLSHTHTHTHTHTYMRHIHRGLSNTLWYGLLASVMELNNWENGVNNSRIHSVTKWFQQTSEKMASIKPPQVMLMCYINWGKRVRLNFHLAQIRPALPANTLFLMCNI